MMWIIDVIDPNQYPVQWSEIAVNAAAARAWCMKDWMERRPAKSQRKRMTWCGSYFYHYAKMGHVEYRMTPRTVIGAKRRAA